MAVKRKKNSTRAKLQRFWRNYRDVFVALLSAVIVFFIIRTGVSYVIDNFIRPVDESDATPIEVVIPSSSSASSIARILYNACGQDEKGLIQNTAVFKVYVDFLGRANTMKAGTYILSKNMSMKQIVDIICEGNPPKKTVTFTIPEGYTVEGIANVLLEKGLIDDPAPFLQACKTGAGFENFDFIKQVMDSPDAAKRAYILEGYLFPDTYEVYADATIDTILIKMLNRFNEIVIDDYKARAAEMGMTLDQLITLAALLEREAQVDDDFSKVSAVFHNRLKENMKLQSCASLSYPLGVTKYTFTAAELELDSPYNTYRYGGLPIGPVSNPGKQAIVAALYPNESHMAEGYLYFCNGNPAVSNALIFSKTYEEHQLNVKTYQQYWK
ncbi:MAG: endolytic transglycosylase MltG [Clostridia bacterium]|nr:endolytic transglycosylase MltG [Clostridia bacterium]